MQTPTEMSPTLPSAETDADNAAPSVSFIQAISQFLDTDPNDLLQELGYYSRETAGSSE